MTTSQDIVQRKESLSQLESDLNKLVAEFNESGLTKRPDFAHFGWSRFSEFVRQLKQARTEPIFEEVRQELLKCGLAVAPHSLDNPVELMGENVVLLASKISEHLIGISNDAVKNAAIDDVTIILRSEDWTKANARAAFWSEAEKRVVDFIHKDPDAPSKTMLQDLARSGPEADTALNCESLSHRAKALGGQGLWTFIAGKGPESLQVLDTEIKSLEDLKTQIEEILGKNYLIPVPRRRSSTCEELEQTLKSRLEELRKQQSLKLSELRTVEIRASDLAMLIGDSPEDTTEVVSLEDIQNRMRYLKSRLNRLARQVKRSLSSEAMTLLEGLGTGELPNDFDNDQIVTGLKEILVGYRLRVELNDA